MKGKLIGVGVGPGDPELMTLKAVRLIRESRWIAVPGKIAEETVAYKIAAKAVPEIEEKHLISIYMPMTHDKEEQMKNHQKGAKELEKYLERGENVVFLTLGDPTIYSTFTYLQNIVEKDGYETELVSGITSFCAAAARVNKPLVLWQEELHVIPAVHSQDVDFDAPGNYVLMKSGRKMDVVKEKLRKSELDVVAVENCGMENEAIYYGVEEIPDTAGYYSLIIAKNLEKS